MPVSEPEEEGSSTLSHVTFDLYSPPLMHGSCGILQFNTWLLCSRVGADGGK
jgi:hypothetical protein